MAKFGEWTKLHISSANKNSDVHFNVLTSEHKLLVTSGGRDISLYNVADGRNEHSWSGKHSHHFSCGVVFDSSAQLFSVVANKRTLLQWKLEDKDISK